MTSPHDDSLFTETAYRDVLALAGARYPFVSFREAAAADRGLLWRHDIDVSVHRALALARLEHDAGVRATYFVHLHSVFYNALEPAIVERLRAIAALGHEFGVHFDPHAHGLAPEDGAGMGPLVVAEAEALRALVGVNAVAVSFHDPDKHGGTVTADDHVGGLVSTYGRTVKERFGYCSDSNGCWRFRRLDEELASDRHQRLQVLTHPEWWVPEAMPPRERIARAINGRAAAIAAGYDATLAAIGRPNLR